jgi:hypothetical protein
MVRTEKSVTEPGNKRDSEEKVEFFIKSVRKILIGVILIVDYKN